MQSSNGVHATRSRRLSLLPAQEQRWTIARHRGSDADSVVGAAFIEGHLDVDALRHALETLAEAHEDLRAHVVVEDGRPVRIVSDAARPELRVLALGPSPRGRSDREYAAVGIAAEDARRPPRASGGGSFRASLVEVEDHYYVLALALDPVLFSDGCPGRLLAELASRVGELNGTGQSLASVQVASIESASLPEGFHLQAVAGAMISIEIPTDRPRLPAFEFDGGVAETTFDVVLEGDIRRLSAHAGVGAPALVRTAMQALLHRSTGQSEFLLGVRRLSDGGMVALRCSVGEDTTFGSLLATSEATLDAGHAHGPLPVTVMSERIDLHRAPVFQVLFATDEGLVRPIRAGALTWTPATPIALRLPHELRVTVRDGGDSLCVRLEYARQLFDAASAERWLGRLETLLASAVRDPSRKIHELELLTPDERWQILVDWNATEIELPSGICAHHLFEEQVSRTPDLTALVFGEARLTYRELDEHADRLACTLRRLGVGPDVLVGLCVERSIEMAVGLLAILKAGGAYVPLDPAYPRERLAWILSDTRAPVLLTQRAIADVLPDHEGAHVLYLDEPRPAESSDAQLTRRVLPEHLGYVIYTSGSTGRPKGICLPHAALVNLIRWHDRSLLRAARTLQFASLSFDASFHEMFAAWASGGSVYLITEAVRRDVTALTRFIATHAIEKAILPVVVVQQMAEQHGDEPDLFRSLRELTTTGEQLHVTRPIAKLFAELPDCTFHNHYGPSETHVVTAYTLAGDPASWPSHPPIGRPIDNTEAYILDPHGRPVPCGVTGELFLGGVCLARGYLGRSDLTSERFIPHPFRDEPGARLYKTGDLARYLPDGNIEFLGRIDHQVKIRGFRIELGEIEGALTQHPLVQEAVVLAREDRPGDRRLVAYVVATDLGHDGTRASSPIVPALRAHLAEHLPEYMLPAAIVTVPAMPLTPNGKVDRCALPAPDTARPELGTAFVAPRSETEAELAPIWAECLGLDAVGVLDNFFELGGDSLRAVQVFARVRQRFGVEISFQYLFAHPTIASSAERVEQTKGTGVRTAAIAAVERTDLLPLSFAQERLWFSYRLSPESPAYNCLYAFRLSGRLDLQALETSVATLVQRHEVLRTTFEEVAGRPFQRIHPRMDVRLDVLDLQGPGDAQDSTLERHLAEAATRPFDLTRGPLVRAGVARLDDDQHVLWLNLHHIVTDGRSMAVFFRELATAYDALRAGKQPAFAAQSIQYADYAAFQRLELTQTLDALVGWWRERLTGAPPLLELPTDRPRPPTQSFRGAAVPVGLDRALTDTLRKLGAENNMTLVMVVLAAFAAFLHRMTHEDDIVIGIPSLGRDRVELEDLLGFFVNTLPVRVGFREGLTFRGLLAEVRQASLDAFEHDALPFERLVHELRIERDPSQNPIVQVAIAPQPPGERDLRLPEISVERVETESQRAVFDLTLFCWETDAGVEATLEYSTDLFDRSTIERFAGHFVTLLSGAAADPSSAVASLPLLTPSEERRLAIEWNETTDAPRPTESCFHDLFAAQAARAPERLAVVEPSGRALTYAELDERSNRLAWHLRELGARPDTVVALAVERSFDLIVGVLGILKSGAAYLPLDPTYPRDRLEYMLSDAKPVALLTQSHLRAQLPSFAPTVVTLDADAEAIAQYPATRLPKSAEPHHLAYVIYTSGSTGRPKGAMIEHRNIVSMTEGHRLGLGVTPDERFLQFASISFDAAIWEIAQTLTIGATLCLLPQGRPPLGVELGRLLRDLRITMTCLPPSVLPDVPVDYASALSTLIVGGEACSAELVKTWAPGRRFINAYGPTECTICATLAVCEPADTPPPIGKPVANVRTYVLDELGKPVPIGVSGELCIGGVGVGRGYIGRPDLTRERFVPDPFSSAPGARMYRTGDIVRLRPDGNIEYVGRRDHQVKVRGFRIELGEIEAAIREHDAVRDVVVLARTDLQGGSRLVAYVVSDARPPAEGVAASTSVTEPVVDAVTEHVSSWKALYDDVFQGPRTVEDGAANFTGWHSSYTKQPLPLDEMHSWRDRTVDRILSLRPRKVWEIGCGTGLLLLPIAPRCERYRGTDISESELALTRAEVASRDLKHVLLEQRRADDFRGIDPGSYDTVVLNSVIQYFPDLEYLRTVIRGAMSIVGPGGVVFLGDVRSLPLHEAFRASVELARAPADLPADSLLGRTSQAIATEPELLIDPEFFHGLRAELPELGHAEVSIKAGREDNELVTYRYDVALFVGPAEEPMRVDASRRFGEFEDGAPSVERWLRDERPESAELLGVPNARVVPSIRLVSWLRAGEGTAAELTNRLRGAGEAAIHPEDLAEIGDRLGYTVRATWSRSGGSDCVDVLFERTGASPRRRPWVPRASARDTRRPLANDPLRLRMERSVPARLRSFLEQKLPSYMVPSDFVLLDALPLGPNGKVDRKALPLPAAFRASTNDGVTPPRNDLERKLVDVWSELLGVTGFGVHDSFFDLGGHSLMVSRVMFRIEDELGIEIPMRALYEAPTIAQIAKVVEAHASGESLTSLCYTPELDLEEEARLDDTIDGSAPPVDVSAPPEHVFLTGATGFVGAHLLAELLATTDARVHCLVRATDRREGLERVRKSLAKYGLPSNALASRLEIVLGDLGAPKMALNPADFDRLGHTIDVILHNGALVDHVRGYATMKGPNVLGTHEVLRLAASRRRKPVHFVSTLGSIYPRTHAAPGRVREDVVPGPLGLLPNGYMQSKCVAEHLVFEAVSRGIPAAIHRLGAITGHSETGACNPNDFTYSAIRSTIQLGFADDLNTDLTITPVDFAARAIVALLRRPRSLGKVFHVTNPRPLFWLDLIGRLKDRGNTIEVVSYAECMTGLLDVARRGVDTPMLAFLPFITQRVPGNPRYVNEDYHAPVEWDCDNLLAGLSEMGVEGPPPPERLLDVYLDYLDRNRLLGPSLS